jgi:xylulokinase
MGELILAYDLGTGGNKVAIYDYRGQCIGKDFEPYGTFYPSASYHEQRPLDWWHSIITGTKRILETSKVDKNNIEAIAISGHSLGAIPIDKDGKLLIESTPIWSDTRAVEQADKFFKEVNEKEWYKITGNSFSRECYTIFKILWYKDNIPGIFKKIYKVIGTKDYINFLLTGNIFTDYSYASGSGVYSLLGWQYDNDLIKAAGIPNGILPEIVPSTHLIGSINDYSSEKLGLKRGIKVFCGGVDNSCMALGAKNISEGRIYLNLGSSAWIAVSSDKPIIDLSTLPFVFAHVIPGMFTSSFGTFAAGSSFKWIKENLCGNIFKDLKISTMDPFGIMDSYAAKSPVGSNKLIFNPSLAGGSKAQPSPNIRGAYVGLSISHKISDVIRSAMEGIALDLKVLYDKLDSLTKLSEDVLCVGGGSNSKLWMQIISDVLDHNIIKTDIGQEAAALGAAAIAAVGTGIWKDFKIIDGIHKIESIAKPVQINVKKYKELFKIYNHVRYFQAEIGDMIKNLKW